MENSLNSQVLMSLSAQHLGLLHNHWFHSNKCYIIYSTLITDVHVYYIQVSKNSDTYNYYIFIKYKYVYYCYTNLAVMCAAWQNQGVRTPWQNDSQFFLLGWEMEPPTQQKELRVSLGAWGFCKAHCDTVQASSPVSIRLSPVIEVGVTCL